MGNIDTQAKRSSAMSMMLDMTLVVPDGSIGIIIRASETWWYSSGSLSVSGGLGQKGTGEASSVGAKPQGRHTTTMIPTAITQTTRVRT